MAQTVYSPAVTTYIPLASITLAADTATVVFSGYSQDYSDLILITNGGSTGAGNITIRLNGDSGSNYAYIYMLGNGSTASGGAGSLSQMQGAGMGNDLNNMSHFTLFDYSSTTKDKTGIFRDSAAALFASIWANRWNNTAAVTSLTVGTTSGSLKSGTTLNLFGIKA